LFQKEVENQDVDGIVTWVFLFTPPYDS
jgi:hypothetical protein